MNYIIQIRGMTGSDWADVKELPFNSSQWRTKWNRNWKIMQVETCRRDEALPYPGVWGLRFAARVWAFGFRVSGFGFRD